MTGSVRYIEKNGDIDHFPFIINFDDGNRFYAAATRTETQNTKKSE